VSILAVTGLAKEARIAKKAGLVAAIGAGDSALLTQRIREVGADAKAVISFGIAGSLSPLLRPGDIVVGTHVVAENEHYLCDSKWGQIIRARLPAARAAIIVGTDMVIGHIAMKKALMRTAGAHCVDMESHIAARFAKERNIPFIALRTICDGNERTLPPAALEPLKPTGRPRLIAILRSLLREPGQFGELMQTSDESKKAFRSLWRCRRVLGAGLGCPYTG
jgi:adenosylhomocysteine nucleosidase